MIDIDRFETKIHERWTVPNWRAHVFIKTQQQNHICVVLTIQFLDNNSFLFHRFAVLLLLQVRWRNSSSRDLEVVIVSGGGCFIGSDRILESSGTSTRRGTGFLVRISRCGIVMNPMTQTSFSSINDHGTTCRRCRTTSRSTGTDVMMMMMMITAGEGIGSWREQRQSQPH